LAGVLFDEVALMPRSFVEQALSRAISYEHPKYWFNCNPESPNHYFYKEWIEDPKDGTTHLHFLLEDNPILTEQMIERTKAMYSGVFYDRYIRGLWVIAEGIIYPMFGKETIVPTVERKYTRYVISMDYGIQNPTAMLLWGFCDGVWYQVSEYYHSGRETNQQKTDQDYYEDLERLAGDRYIDCLIIDPSATSFIALVKQKRRFKIRKADNDVIDGIQKTASAIQQGKIKVNDCCKRTIKEYGLYSWDQKADEDRPIKDNDHAMDATRYFVNTMKIMKPKSEYISLLN
jgi:PBSX family phage terminase large subunit